ncbi:MAG: hypothetical protein J3K34DRAFT_399790, partial [Monoraphidium minutum]
MQAGAGGLRSWAGGAFMHGCGKLAGGARRRPSAPKERSRTGPAVSSAPRPPLLCAAQRRAGRASCQMVGWSRVRSSAATDSFIPADGGKGVALAPRRGRGTERGRRGRAPHAHGAAAGAPRGRAGGAAGGSAAPSRPRARQTLRLQPPRPRRRRPRAAAVLGRGSVQPLRIGALGGAWKGIEEAGRPPTKRRRARQSGATPAAAWLAAGGPARTQQAGVAGGKPQLGKRRARCAAAPPRPAYRGRAPGRGLC